jgi:hypothetical protein
MAWGWIKKIKNFGKQAFAKAGSLIKGGKEILTKAKPFVGAAIDRFAPPKYQEKAHSWLDKAESYLDKAEHTANRYSGGIQPRYRSDNYGRGRDRYEDDD